MVRCRSKLVVSINIYGLWPNDAAKNIKKIALPTQLHSDAQVIILMVKPFGLLEIEGDSGDLESFKVANR